MHAFRQAPDDDDSASLLAAEGHLGGATTSAVLFANIAGLVPSDSGRLLLRGQQRVSLYHAECVWHAVIGETGTKRLGYVMLRHACRLAGLGPPLLL